MKRKLKTRLWLVAIINRSEFKVMYYTINVSTCFISGSKYSCDDVCGVMVSPAFKDIWNKYNLEKDENLLFELLPFPRVDYAFRNLKIGHWYNFNDNSVRFLVFFRNKAGYFYNLCYKYIVNWVDGSKAHDYAQLYNILNDYKCMRVPGLYRFYALPFPDKEDLSIMVKMI